jgi:hypothetical protein
VVRRSEEADGAGQEAVGLAEEVEKLLETGRLLRVLAKQQAGIQGKHKSAVVLEGVWIRRFCYSSIAQSPVCELSHIERHP